MKKNITKTVGLMIVLLMIHGSTAAAQQEETKQIVLKFLPGVSERTQIRLYERLGVEKVDSILGGKVHLLSVSSHAADKVVQALSKNKQVEFAELDVLHELNVSPNDPLIGNQWYLTKIQAFEAWDTATGSNVVLVSAPDTGIRATHQDLQNILRMDLSYNAVDDSDDSSPVHSHGTATAGMISAQADNAVGIASAQWADSVHHIPVRVTNLGSGSAYSSNIAKGVEYAADNGAKVISVSYSGVGGSLRRQAGAYARSLGALFFNSAGNTSGREDYHSGGNWEEIIAVSSTTSADALSSFSSYGPYVDLAAPGSSVYTTSWGSDSSYGNASGTSFSSPLAGSVAALLFSSFPLATHLQVEQALFDGAADLGNPGWDELFGHGRVDAYGSMAALDTILNISENNSPDVSFYHPSEGGDISENINIDIMATDDTNVDYVDLNIDGEYYATDPLGDADHYIFHWDIADYGNGAHVLEAVAYDVYGNSKSESMNVNIAKPIPAQPNISIVSLEEGQCVKGAVSVTTSTTNAQSVDFFKETSFMETDNTDPFSSTYDFRRKGKPKNVLVKVVAWNDGESAEDSITVVDGGCDSGSSDNPKPAKCNDGKDNDRDGFIDYPDDLDCTSEQDDNERR